MTVARQSTIEGQPVLIVENQPPLPRRLDELLAAMFAVSQRASILPSGARRECEQLRSHPFRVLRVGRYLGPDRVLRDLRVEMCPFCGATCVRDITYDRISGLPTGRRGAKRRDQILGWYSGARRNRREYR